MKTSGRLMIMLHLLVFAPAFIAQTRQPAGHELFPVEQVGKWGFIDRTEKIVIPLQFDGANEFHAGLALVTSGGQKAFINEAGQIVIKPDFDIVDDFSEGLAAVNIGQRRIPNLGVISNPGKWGYIDKTGKLVIPLKFTHAEDFSEGLAAVKIKGEIVWCPSDASGNRAGSTMMYGYIDKAGKIVIPAVFDSAEPFREGVAAVSKCDEAYFITKTGRTVISGGFRYASSFSGGLAHVETMTKSGLLEGYVDKTGKMIWPPAR